jgi:6,7-dimethyl-8-ribityllumazine synthase
MATVNKNLSVYDKNSVPKAKHFRFRSLFLMNEEAITEGLYNGQNKHFKKGFLQAYYTMEWKFRTVMDVKKC